MGKGGSREKSAGLKPGLYNCPWPEWKRMVGGANQAWGEFRFGSLPWWTGNPKTEEAVIAGFAAIGA